MFQLSAVLHMPQGVYKLQVQPGGRRLVVNQGYEGVALVDPTEPAIAASTSFSDGFLAQGRAISAWCLSGDGERVLAIDESGTACLLSFAGSEPRDVTFPLPQRLHDLRYLWTDSELLVGSGYGYQHGVFRMVPTDANPKFVEMRRIHVHKRHREWGRALNALRGMAANAERVDCARRTMLVHRHEPPGELIAVSWCPLRVRTGPAPNQVPRLALWNEQFLVGDEREIQLVPVGGAEVRPPLAIPAEWELSDLDVVPAVDGEPACLVISARSLLGDGSQGLLIYRETPNP